ncbi:MAG TPA: MFS transporter [Kofleriaceae bacterium]
MSGIGVRTSGIAPAHKPPPKVLVPATVLFLMMTAHAILETARDALFLTRLGPYKLGYAYIAIAGVALLAVWVVRKLAPERGARAMLATFLVAATIGTAILSVLLTTSPWAAFVLYVWTGAVASLMVPTFWLIIERDVRIGEAKKVLSAIAAGGGLGALVGSAIASVLGHFLHARYLVTAGAIAFAVAAMSVNMLTKGRPDEEPEDEPETEKEPIEPVKRESITGRTRRYGALLVVLAVVSTVTLTMGDMMFKRLMVERLPRESLAMVFGATYTGLNVIALMVQIGVTPKLLEKLGVGSSLAVLPVLVLLTTSGFVITGATMAVFALKLADGGMRNSVHRVVNEILFVPMPAAEREKAKPLAESLGQRGGQAIAAGVALAIAADGHATKVLAIATLASCVLWLAVVATTRRAYVRRFRDTLEAAGIHREARLPVMDAPTIELLVETLASPDEREALVALDLLSQRGERIPALVLYHPSDSVVRHALSLLEGDLRPDVARILSQLTSHTDPQIRAAALAASSRTGLHREQLIAALGDREPDVRAAAVVGLETMRGGKQDVLDVQGTLEALRDGSTADRVALAHAIARRPDPAFAALLLQLMAKKEPQVTREVLHAWELEPTLADVERLLSLLEDPHVRGDARRVFIAGGPKFLERLLEALDDPRTPLSVRRHLPRTISRFATQEAAVALVGRLPREPDGSTEFKILRALGRMRADKPDLHIDAGPIRAYARRSTDDAVRYSRLRAALSMYKPAEEMPGYDLLRELLAEKRQHAIERVFRALGILHPRDDMRSIHDALLSEQAEHRAAAREILEHLLPADERNQLFDVIRGVPADSDALKEKFPTDKDIIAALLADPSVSLRCVAAHHVVERKMVALRDELVRLKPVTASPLVTSAFEQALARLPHA